AAGDPVHAPDVAASFQEAVADVLTRKAVQACQRNGVTDLIIGGGVAANSRLRSLAAARCDAAGIKLRVPRPGRCTGTGAMAAGGCAVAVGAVAAEVAADGITGDGCVWPGPSCAVAVAWSALALPSVAAPASVAPASVAPASVAAAPPPPALSSVISWRRFWA